ncbi:MAG TPA: ATP-dependent helicase C-terminal domain-containing protein [Bacteriovoracaceae bacterium]|nr:ATP-dependent helicase C-terminal domain-containing protein [Bacteriovoracaceae bacterium]
MKQSKKIPLPIDPYLDEILTSLREYSTLIVRASPGSGKTTRLPWAIFEQLGKRVTVLEPRRIAAKMAATRIAEEEGLRLGEEIGYHFRFEKNVKDTSSVIFYTEGTFLKKFSSDPLLRDTDVVILDEFHERHLETDLALALLLDLQKKRPGLKLVLMSATVDLTFFIGGGMKVIDIEARQYQVELRYLPNVPSVLNDPLELKIKKAVLSVADLPGDILVFVPGMREIQRVSQVLNGPYKICFLHGELSREEQEAALLPADVRKIILSTNIAESSVTIPGIRIVIDSGIQREAIYSSWNGLRTIEDHQTTQSSCVQRAGRAGRTSDGLCLRLFSEQDFRQRPLHAVPEILKSDLSATYLQLRATGLDPVWLTPPPADKWQKARDLCRQLGAVDEQSSITSIGRKMLTMPVSLRSARILVEAQKLNPQGRRILLNYVCEVLEKDRTGKLYQRLQASSPSGPAGGESAWERCVLTGFIDQVAKYRPATHDLTHYSGKTLRAHSSLRELEEGFYLVIDITQRQEASVCLPVDEDWLWELEPFPLVETMTVEITEHILVKTRLRLGSILLEESSKKINWSAAPSQVQQEVLTKTKEQFSRALASFKESEAFGRLHLWAAKSGEDAESSLAALSPGEFFEKGFSFGQDDLVRYFTTSLTERLGARDLARDLPDKLRLKGPKELKVHYLLNMDPFIEAPIQDFYGLTQAPTLMNGKVELTVKLLGPHKRPVQITRDLKGFWERMYKEFVKEWQRDYPRHHWPDKPWEAKPFLLKSHLK